MKQAAEPAKHAARRFVQAIKPQDRLATLLFANTAELAHPLSITRDFALSAINRYVPSGGTALYDALSTSLSLLRDAEGRRVVVLVTDGRDEDNAGTGPGSVSTFESVLTDLKKVEAIVYAIGLGAGADRKVMEAIAEASGGEAYFPDDVSGLDEQYRRIVEHLRRRWVIGYTSTNPARDGSWRRVEIKVKSGLSLVKSAGGYFAPAR
jgi:VWFA-related protein